MKIFMLLGFLLISGCQSSVGFKKQSAEGLVKHVPRERILADSQQMLDAQDSRKHSFTFL